MTNSPEVVETESYPWTAWLTREVPYIAKIEQRWPDGSRHVTPLEGHSVIG